jgi:hypothetical protein
MGEVMMVTAEMAAVDGPFRSPMKVKVQQVLAS